MRNKRGKSISDRLWYQWKIYFRISVSVEHLSLMINRTTIMLLCKWHVKLHKAHKEFHAISYSLHRIILYSYIHWAHYRTTTKMTQGGKYEKRGKMNFPNEYFIKKWGNKHDKSLLLFSAWWLVCNALKLSCPIGCEFWSNTRNKF